jgi:hypothetical protein
VVSWFAPEITFDKIVLLKVKTEARLVEFLIHRTRHEPSV